MTTQQQAYMLFLSDELLKGMWVPNMVQNESALRARASYELRRQHAEIEALRAGYDAARLEIASLHTQMEAVGAGGMEPLVCDYCGALTPDPWHSSGMLHGKMSKHIHSCDACAARGAERIK